jgi:hypothetical protein
VNKPSLNDKGCTCAVNLLERCAVHSPDYDPVCVICGEPWEPAIKNRCECGGFCTWGPAKGAEPDSWVKDEKGRYWPKMPSL